MYIIMCVFIILFIMLEMILSLPFIIIIAIVLIMSITVIKEYERGIMFTMGKFSGIKFPGWRLVIPIFQSMMKVDMRLKAVDVPNQEAITKDNIPVSINAVVYYKIHDAAKAVLEVESFYYAMSQLAQTTMRNAIGAVSLDELLQSRAKVSEGIKAVMADNTDNWGILVSTVELKDIVIPDNLKRVISKVAEAEREKQSVIIKAEGDKMAAENIAAAAKTMSETPGALHLRTLQSIENLASDQSNTTIWMVPIEVLDALKGFVKK